MTTFFARVMYAGARHIRNNRQRCRRQIDPESDANRYKRGQCQTRETAVAVGETPDDVEYAQVGEAVSLIGRRGKSGTINFVANILSFAC